MDMQLVPVYADEAGADGGVKISPSLQQNLGVRFATVRREDTRDSYQLIGTTQFDESATQVVQSRVTGYIDRLYARTPLQKIKRGEPIASLFVPDWIAPQEEYLALRRSGNNELASAARQRMRAMSIPDGLIAQAERSGQAQQHFTLTSPVTGVVTELPVRDGAMVSPGMTIAKVSGLDKVWLVAEVPEAMINTVRTGMTVAATFSGNGDRQYNGKVRDILPGVSATTRTAQARLELDNRDGSLTPGMLMRIRLDAGQTVSRLLVPSEAVIANGKQSVVLVAGDNNSMHSVVVTTGRDIGNDTEILSGLAEGQKVIASGQFLIDSEANLKSALPKFVAEQGAANNAHADHAMQMLALYRGTGKVERITATAITLSHAPIHDLQWGAMTMDFNKPQPDAFKDIKIGQDVTFAFREGKSGYDLEQIELIAGDKR
jgi:Cu(I)/Ag(I) efflux system membrane fusion protein